MKPLKALLFAIKRGFPFLCLFFSGGVAISVIRAQTVRHPAPAHHLPDTGAGGNLVYKLQDAFPGMTFRSPVAAVTPPGETNRLFIVERIGVITEIPDLGDPHPRVFLNITNQTTSNWEQKKVEGLTSLSFHPGFATNGYFFVTYTLVTNTVGGAGNHNRISRFTARDGFASADSEMPLITQFDEGDGHNFNDSFFGSDGYLYVACGDEGDGGNGDDYHNAQRIDKDFFSAILRIDVDNKPENLAPNPHPSSAGNYSIPLDNPFVGATNFNGNTVDPSNVRTEFFAVGLRNPWRMTRDPATGWIMEGDVGQHSWEEINVIVKGANYGWSFREGDKVGPAGNPPDWLRLTGPIHQYAPGFGPNQGFSVIGGLIYRGERIPGLYGKYIFADYVSGNIWTLGYNGSVKTSLERILSRKGIAGFGKDPRNGDVLMMDHDAGIIWRLDYSTEGSQPLPPTLADTGLFSNLASLVPDPGLAPYEINVPFWSDNALKRRWFSVPDDQWIDFRENVNWVFPKGTIWVKHFDIEMFKGFPRTRRRLETRILYKQSEGVYGLSYRWDASGTNATLVGEAGEELSLSINDSGQIRTQIWKFPSRSDCLACHTAVGGFALGFNTPQLNRDINDGAETLNQLHALSKADFFTKSLGGYLTLPVLVPATNTAVSREFRARSYLAANCVQCHQPGGSSQNEWDARSSTPLSAAGMINGKLFDLAGDPMNRVIAPGVLEKSMLYQRVANLGPRHMPPLGTTVLDKEAVELLRGWIHEDLAGYETYDEWRGRVFGSTNAPLSQKNDDADQDGASNLQEYLLKTNPLDASEHWGIEIKRLGETPHIFVDQKPNLRIQLEYADTLGYPMVWTRMEIPQNKPFYSASGSLLVIPDYSAGRNSRYYQVKVFER